MSLAPICQDPTTRASAEPRVPRTLLSLMDDGFPDAALHRAVQTAAALGHELFVLRVLRDATRYSPLFPHNDVAAALESLVRSEKAVRQTRSWLFDVVRDESLLERLAVRTGRYEDVTIAHAKALGAAIVVLPSCSRRMGRIAATVACAIGKPVVVAKPRGKEDSIVAATSLAEEGYPVLRRAAALGRRLGSRMIAVHNVVPFLSVTPVLAPFATTDSISSVLELRTRRLRNAARRLSASSNAVLTVGLDSCKAILEEARARKADMVVVGARRRSWIERLLSSDVAADVVDAAKRTVVVEPLPDASLAH